MTRSKGTVALVADSAVPNDRSVNVAPQAAVPSGWIVLSTRAAGRTRRVGLRALPSDRNEGVTAWASPVILAELKIVRGQADVEWRSASKLEILWRRRGTPAIATGILAVIAAILTGVADGGGSGHGDHVGAVSLAAAVATVLLAAVTAWRDLR